LSTCHFQEKDRPSSEELCQMLSDLKESREYRESVQQIQDKIQLNDDQVVVLTQQLEEKDRMLLETDNEIFKKRIEHYNRKTTKFKNLIDCCNRRDNFKKREHHERDNFKK
jgi:hypothetical protein